MDELRDQLGNVNDQLTTLGTRIVELLVVLLIAVLVSRWLRRRIRRRFATATSPELEVVVENSASIGVYIIAITLVLGFWGMTWQSLITALSIGTVAVAFGFQDFLRSVVGGVLVLVERPFSLGDRIKIRDVEGRVERIELRTTVIRSDNDDRIAVPNALMFSDPVINRSPNRVYRVINVSGIEGTPSELKERAQKALANITGFDGLPKITVRTRKGRHRMRRVLDAFPGVELDMQGASSEAVGYGLKVVSRGDRDPATLDEVKRRLQAAFPGARITS